jgi:hypothetical protein
LAQEGEEKSPGYGEETSHPLHDQKRELLMWQVQAMVKGSKCWICCWAGHALVILDKVQRPLCNVTGLDG